MFSATDPDVGATQAWSLAGADGGDFAITTSATACSHSSTRPTTTCRPTAASPRAPTSHLVTVQVAGTTARGNTATRPVTVRVDDLDVNEAPTVSGDLTPQR